MASLLRQVASQQPDFPSPLVELYEEFRKQDRKPQLQDLKLTLLNVCQTFDQVFIAVDALDECDEGTRQKHTLPFLGTLQKNPRIRLFVTSRPFPEDIRKALNLAPQITVQASDADLRKYLRRRIEDSANADIIDEDFRQYLIEKITKRARKMYADLFLSSAAFIATQRLTFDVGSCYQPCRFQASSMSLLQGKWKTQLKLCHMTCTRLSIRHLQGFESSQTAESDWA